MALGYTGDLYILAFDHRGSFKKQFGISGSPGEEELARLRDGKRLIFEGYKSAVDQGAPRDAAGVLVDEEFGTDVAREAQKEGYLFAMPVEKSGQDEFDFEYGDEFSKHIEDFDPAFSKVLVRYNPEGDKGMNERQTGRLKQLSDWLHANDRKFLFELLVPGEQSQLDSVGGDADRYDKEVRPNLMLGAITELQNAGVEPDIWKIEGIDKREDCERIAQQVRSGGRNEVACVVLGRGRGRRCRRPLAEAGRRSPRLHRLRDRPHDLGGRSQGIRGRQHGARRGDRADRQELRALHRGVQERELKVSLSR